MKVRREQGNFGQLEKGWNLFMLSSYTFTHLLIDLEDLGSTAGAHMDTMHDIYYSPGHRHAPPRHRPLRPPWAIPRNAYHGPAPPHP